MASSETYLSIGSTLRKTLVARVVSSALPSSALASEAARIEAACLGTTGVEQGVAGGNGADGVDEVFQDLAWASVRECPLTAGREPRPWPWAEAGYRDGLICPQACDAYRSPEAPDGREPYIGRTRAELDELARFLDAVASGPVGLLLEGDAGIGKTTLARRQSWRRSTRSYLRLSLPAGRVGGPSSPSPRSATCSRTSRFGGRRAARSAAPGSQVALLQIDAEDRRHFPAVSLGVLGVLRALAASGPARHRSRRRPVARPTLGEPLEFAARRLRERADRLPPLAPRGRGDVPLALVERSRPSGPTAPHRPARR